MNILASAFIIHGGSQNHLIIKVILSTLVQIVYNKMKHVEPIVVLTWKLQTY